MENRAASSDPEFRGSPRSNDPSDAPRRPAASSYRRPFLLRVLRVPDQWTSPRRGRRSRSKTRGSVRPTTATDRRNRQARPIAAAVLLAALTLGWLAAGHRSRAAGSNAVLGAPASASTTVAVSSRTVDPACTPPPTNAEVRCTLDGVRLEVRSYPPGTAAAAYRHASGVAAGPHTGPPACERGEPDERAWSEPSAPAVAIGRYRCLLENGRAVMWWTRGDRLLHAVATDADLAALFAWWRAHPAE